MRTCNKCGATKPNHEFAFIRRTTGCTCAMCLYGPKPYQPPAKRSTRNSSNHAGAKYKADDDFEIALSMKHMNDPRVLKMTDEEWDSFVSGERRKAGFKTRREY